MTTPLPIPTEVFGKPHFEVLGRYGYHESVIARCVSRREANEVAATHRANDSYPTVYIQHRPF